jgi:hypothetical protein
MPWPRCHGTRSRPLVPRKEVDGAIPEEVAEKGTEDASGTEDFAARRRSDARTVEEKNHAMPGRKQSRMGEKILPTTAAHFYGDGIFQANCVTAPMSRCCWDGLVKPAPEPGMLLIEGRARSADPSRGPRLRGHSSRCILGVPATPARSLAGGREGAPASVPLLPCRAMKRWVASVTGFSSMSLSTAREVVRIGGYGPAASIESPRSHSRCACRVVGARWSRPR